MGNGGYVIVVGAEIVRFIVSAGSLGHGFKTGPAVGEAIANLSHQRILEPFSPARFLAA